MNEKLSVAIVGAGEIGQAIGNVLSDKAEIRYWDKDETKIREKDLETGALPELIPASQVVFLCVPSWATREALMFVTPYLSKGSVVVSVAKGMDTQNGLFVTDVLTKLIPKTCFYSILGGALIAEDLLVGGEGRGVIASNDKKANEFLKELFLDTKIKVVIQPDIKGLAMAGVLKNIYALGYGLVVGLDWKDNIRGIYLGQAILEMLKLESLLGSKKSVLMEAGILGDFLATSLSKNSLNHQVGSRLARGEPIHKISEGFNSLPVVAKLVEKKLKSLPILNALTEVVVEKNNPQEVFSALEKAL